MALIGAIRKRSFLVLIVIGVGMLAFILGDAMQNNGGGQGELRIGEAFGSDITNVEFDTRVQIEEDNRTAYGGLIDEATRKQIRNQVWSQMVRELVLDPELDELGISVPNDEFFDMISGENISTSLSEDPSFKDSFGVYSSIGALTMLNNLEESQPGYYQQLKQNLLTERRFDKYRNLIKQGLYATTNEAQHDYLATSDQLSLNFVIQKYNELSDSLVSWTEDELVAYFEAHKTEARFKQSQESRAIDYVIFPVVASAQDSAEMRDKLVAMASVLKAEEDDSLYCYNNTDANTSFPGYRMRTWIGQNQADSTVTDLFMSADSGQVIGPYTDRGIWKVAKVIGMRMRPDSASCRHILINAPEGGDRTVQRAFADSLLAELNDNVSKFETFVTDFSQDQGSIENGGVYENFPSGQMVPPFENACFFNPIGTLTIAETTYGFHIIEVLGHVGLSKEVQKVELEKQISATNATADSIFSLASEFAINNDKAVKFDAAATEYGYVVLPATGIVPASQSIGGVPNSRKIVTWMFSAEKGEVSETFDLSSAIVVAKLSGIRPEGIAALEDIRPSVEQAIKKAKKVEYCTKQMSGFNDLQALADKLELKVQPPMNAVAFTSNTMVGGGGNEPEIIGHVFALEQGAISPPLEGEAGVYVIQVVSKTPGAASSDNYGASRADLMQRMAMRVDYEVFTALQKAAGVKDERDRVY
jgi:peptidyl-prolyl cis-trans isomerase D